jgi:hypothetical protein
MRRTATLTLAVGALSLGLSFSTAQATPGVGMTPLVAKSSGTVEKVHFRCVRRCLRHTDLSPWACRRRCFAGGGWDGFGGRCVRRCLTRTDLPSWACRRKCMRGFGRFDGDSGFGRFDGGRGFGRFNGGGGFGRFDVDSGFGYWR